MNQIRPLGETAESVTLSRTDFEALQEELEDAADRIAVLEDCLLDAKPDLSKYVLTMDETMRIIDGEHPVKVWGEKRGKTVRELADSLGLHDVEIENIEKGGVISRDLLLRISSHLDVLPDMLIPPEVAE
jgi:DNA-binding Xre family transcriptional regulator